MIILCADDYGISGGVSRGILELCEAGRLSATSAMVTFERWQQDAARLGPIRATTALGLHLNLTLGRPLLDQAGATHLDQEGRLLPIGTLIRRAAFRNGAVRGSDKRQATTRGPSRTGAGNEPSAIQR